MRHFLLSMKTLSRRRRQSSVAAAAYRRGARLQDARTGRWHDYRRRADDIVSTDVYLPSDAPAWARNPVQLWSRNEIHNRRRDSLVAREILVAIPNELSPTQAIELVGEFAQYLAQTYRIGVDACIHRPPGAGDRRNMHAHILMTTSSLSASGFGTKVQELDPIAMRHLRNAQDQTPSGANPLNAARHLRPFWQGLVNRRLATLGVADLVDCRSYQEQRGEALARGDWTRAEALDRLPRRHLGPARVACLRKDLRREVTRPLARTPPAHGGLVHEVSKHPTLLASRHPAGGGVGGSRISEFCEPTQHRPLYGPGRERSAMGRYEGGPGGGASISLTLETRFTPAVVSGDPPKRRTSIRRLPAEQKDSNFRPDEPLPACGPVPPSPPLGESTPGRGTSPPHRPIRSQTASSLQRSASAPALSDVPQETPSRFAQSSWVIIVPIQASENARNAPALESSRTERSADRLIHSKPYRVITTEGGLEIRDYADAIVILTAHASSLKVVALHSMVRAKGWDTVRIRGAGPLCEATWRALSTPTNEVNQLLVGAPAPHNTQEPAAPATQISQAGDPSTAGLPPRSPFNKIPLSR